MINRLLSILFVLFAFGAKSQGDIGVTAIVNPSGIVCSAPFQAVITVENFGANTVTSANILYNLDGAANSTKSWTGTLAPGETIQVTISNINTTPGAHIFNASTDVPNGGADANSTNDAANSNFTLSDPITFTATVTNTNCGAEEGAITVNASGGNGALQYSADNGANFQSSNSFSALGAGDYVVIVEDANGCRELGQETVQANGAPSILNVSVTDPACYGESSGVIVISPGNGYQYSIDGGVTYKSVGSFPNLPAGYYNIRMRDNTGCAAIESATLSSPPKINTLAFGTNASCNNNNGSASVIANGGAGTFSYQWDDPSNQASSSASNLDVGLYHITVTDGDGCAVVDSVLIGNNNGPEIGVETTDALCNGESTGTALAIPAGGSAPYLFQWNDIGNQTTQTATGLAAGSYEVLVTDNNGCKGVGQAFIGEPSVLSVSASGVNTSCGQANGSAFAQVSGGTYPYSYLWSSSVNDTLSSNVALNAGTYTVDVIDANGCTTSGATDILGSTSMSISDSVVNVSCDGVSDGSITISISGGTSPHSILWSTGDSTDTLLNLASGDYSVVVMDANGCSIGANYKVVSLGSECVIIPTAFSPNGDGKNDVFEILGTHIESVVSVQVFNRWGDIVYASDDYQNDWNGQYNGSDLVAGSYHCIIKIDDEDFYMGPVTIIR